MTVRDPSGRGGGSDPHADVAGALHDVSNTLTVILGWAAEARAGSASPEALLHALEVIEEQAQIAQHLARRAIGAETSLVWEETQLDVVLGTAIDVLGVAAHRKNVRLTLAGRPGGARVRRSTDLHPDREKPGPERPRVRACRVRSALRPRRRGHRIDARGPGPGPRRPRGEEAAPRSSKATRRAKAAPASRAPLRLVTWRARPSGSIEARRIGDRGAVPPGRGRAGGSLSMPPPSMPSAPVLAGRRVLIVEDDEHVALLLEAALSSRGATVRVVRDRRGARAGPPHGRARRRAHRSVTDRRGRERRAHSASQAIAGRGARHHQRKRRHVLPEEAALDGVRWVREAVRGGRGRVGRARAAALKPRLDVALRAGVGRGAAEEPLDPVGHENAFGPASAPPASAVPPAVWV